MRTLFYIELLIETGNIRHYVFTKLCFYVSYYQLPIDCFGYFHAVIAHLAFLYNPTR